MGWWYKGVNTFWVKTVSESFHINSVSSCTTYEQLFYDPFMKIIETFILHFFGKKKITIEAQNVVCITTFDKSYLLATKSQKDVILFLHDK